MSILVFMIPITLFLALVFLIFFIWATRSGQFDDLTTPAHRILIDDEENNNKIKNNLKEKKGQPR